MRRFFSFFTGTDEEWFRRTVAVVIAVVAALTAVAAFLQSDAAARDDRANRDSKRYATEAMGRKVSGSARANYDYNTAYHAWAELDLLASAAAGREDIVAGERYADVRDSLVPLSPLLESPYFDDSTGTTDLIRYQVDTYLVEVTGLEEKFSAAVAVKEAWDAKANTYIVHLTLLAVSLFLLGLSVTISGPATRWLFAGMGVVVAIVAVVWAVGVLAQPVPDLRERSGAIEAYAAGVGLAYQENYTGAMRAYDTALQIAPDYAHALAARAEARLGLGDLEGAAADLEQARAAGDSSANVAGELAWTYYLLGRFDEAIEMNRVALEAGPGELWIRFDLALALLVSGQAEAAQAEYAAAMEQAAQQVAAARAAKEEPPSDVWWSLDDSAAGDLDDLMSLLATGEGLPPRDVIAYPEAVSETTQGLLVQVKSLAVALEYTGRPPAGTLTAQIDPFQFGSPVYDDGGALVDLEPSDTFPVDTQAVVIQFDYAGMHDGQEVVFKVYIDGEEDPSWRLAYTWDLGAEGTAQRLLTLEYSDSFVLASGQYVVELYVDSHLAQRGGFVVRGQ